MNIDAKFPNKMLAIESSKMPEKSQQDQLGFTPDMQGWFNIRKLIIVTHYINKLKNKNKIMLIDAEKSLIKYKSLSW